MKQRNSSWVGRFALAVAVLLVTGAEVIGQGAKLSVKSGNEYLDIFAADGSNLITRPEHLGIVSDMASVGISHDVVGKLDGLWAIPYVSSDFHLVPLVWGERIRTEHYVWRPFQASRIGRVRDVEVTSTTTLIYGKRAGVLQLKFRNLGSSPTTVPLQLVANNEFTYRVTLDKEPVWDFAQPRSKTPVRNVPDDKGILRVQGDYAVALGVSLEGVRWEEPSRRFHGQLQLQPGQELTVAVVFAIGPKDEAVAQRNEVLESVEAEIEEAKSHYIAEVKNIYDRLPRFSSDNKSLEQMYNRSLSIFITNKMNVPDFILNPYYGTGAVKGGCTVNYLWNFGQVFQVLHMLDPEAGRTHIIQFIKSGGLDDAYAFYPLNGKTTGTWYMVNQEKIIRHVYHYVKLTGDRAFLDVEVEDGKTVLDAMVESALLLDDISKPVRLVDYGVDYGASNSHLELRREFRYNHVMPDMNGRRYNNYKRVSELCAWAGKPQPVLMKRAAALKKVLKDQLWDPSKKWFAFQDSEGNSDIRYTVQMYKLFDSDVLDKEIEDGLLSHLNEEEFLSEYGLHSMSKLDIAYDQVDIDNGGGGNCTSFTPLIIGFLYQDGKTSVADDIFRRILWWGERLPYFSDSQYATEIGYRLDTPLQSNISTGVPAQTILFAMFGIDVAFDGTITINPVGSQLASTFELSGLKLRGKDINIRVEGGEYTVSVDSKTYKKKLGTATVIKK